MATSRTSNAEIAQYYRETRWHYRGLWTGRHSLALHYGYWGPGVTNHVDALHRLNEVLADNAGIEPGQLVLDAGCGWGGSCIWLARERQARCEGITLGPDQVEKGREKAQHYGLSHLVSFRVADFHRTEFPDATFDVVWASESVCHSNDKERFCREAFRVLKPGGRLTLSDFFRSGRDLGPKGERLLQAWLSCWVVDDLATFDEFDQHLKKSGFQVLSLENATSKIRPSSVRLARTGLLTAPMALLFRLVRIHSAMQHNNWKSSILQHLALRKDLWKYGIFSAQKPR